jgi:cbb3-type cytochrome oxidase maturation protein
MARVAGAGLAWHRPEAMDILYLLVPLSVLLVFLIGAVFWLALKGGQFDDLEGPGLRVIADDDRPQNETRE